jgi:lipopolysaccharide biosynthesis glycosyltransferase
MVRVFIGYDENETVAYHVLSHSILRNASVPVSISPLKKELFRGFFNRPRGEYDSTDFAITRFLVPFLCDYEGYAVFMDCDMLCLGDIGDLANYMTLMDHYNTAVRVVKHEYSPSTKTKFLDQVQTTYSKKNWSSVMVFNNTLCRNLTPEYVEKAHGLDLHQFKWCNDYQIGGLPMKWNFLVGEYKADDEMPKLIHYTLGTPCFKEYENCEYGEMWRAEYKMMVSHG